MNSQIHLHLPPPSNSRIKGVYHHTQHIQNLKADSWVSTVIQLVKVLVFKTNNNTTTDSTLKTEDKHTKHSCVHPYILIY